jgi:hypothetical protein
MFQHNGFSERIQRDLSAKLAGTFELSLRLII